VGAAAMVVETGGSVVFHRGQRFPMQSVYKLPIGMAVLHDVDAGVLRLDQKVTVAPSDLVPRELHSPIRDEHPEGARLTVRELLRYAVEESDGTASDVLLRLAGGPQRVTRYLRRLGVRGVVVATSERLMASGDQVQYRNWAAPEAMAGLLRLLQQGKSVSGPARTLLFQYMTRTKTFPSRIKGMLPAATVVAHKTGSSGVSNGLARATNDVGLITMPNGRHLAVVVFVSDSRADDATRDAVIARIARAAWDHASK